jgi:hypothetical protein
MFKKILLCLELLGMHICHLLRMHFSFIGFMLRLSGTEIRINTLLVCSFLNSRVLTNRWHSLDIAIFLDGLKDRGLTYCTVE